MKDLFCLDGKLFETLSKIADLLLLNILFIISCLPIFTIGASLTALSYTTLKLSKNEDFYVAKDFLSAFKSNFKQATSIWILFVFLMLFLCTDLYILNHILLPFSFVITCIISTLCILCLMTGIYVFPILSKFYNSSKNTVKNALLMSIRHLPWTVVLFALYFSPLLLIIWNQSMIGTVLLLFLLIGFSALSLFASYIFHKIFSLYLNHDVPSDL